MSSVLVPRMGAPKCQEVQTLLGGQRTNSCPGQSRGISLSLSSDASPYTQCPSCSGASPPWFPKDQSDLSHSPSRIPSLDLLYGGGCLPACASHFTFDRRILVVQDRAMKWGRSFMWLQSDFSWGCSRRKAWLGWTTKMAPSHGWLLRLAVIWELIWGCQPTCGLSMRLEIFTA